MPVKYICDRCDEDFPKEQVCTLKVDTYGHDNRVKGKILCNRCVELLDGWRWVDEPTKESN